MPSHNTDPTLMLAQQVKTSVALKRRWVFDWFLIFECFQLLAAHNFFQLKPYIPSMSPARTRQPYWIWHCQLPSHHMNNRGQQAAKRICIFIGSFFSHVGQIEFELVMWKWNKSYQHFSSHHISQPAVTVILSIMYHWLNILIFWSSDSDIMKIILMFVLHKLVWVSHWTISLNNIACFIQFITFCSSRTLFSINIG